MFLSHNLIRLNSSHDFTMKFTNKPELQQIPITHSSDIICKVFMKLYKECIAKPYFFLINDTVLPADKPLRFRHIVLKVM